MQCMQMSESLSYTKFAGSPIMSLHLSSTKENIAVTMTSSTYFSEGKSKSSSDVVFASPWSSYLFSIQPSFHYVCIHTLFQKAYQVPLELLITFLWNLVSCNYFWFPWCMILLAAKGEPWFGSLFLHWLLLNGLSTSKMGASLTRSADVPAFCKMGFSTFSTISHSLDE